MTPIYIDTNHVLCCYNELKLKFSHAAGHAAIMQRMPPETYKKALFSQLFTQIKNGYLHHSMKIARITARNINSSNLHLFGGSVTARSIWGGETGSNTFIV